MTPFIESGAHIGPGKSVDFSACVRVITVMQIRSDLILNALDRRRQNGDATPRFFWVSFTLGRRAATVSLLLPSSRRLNKMYGRRTCASRYPYCGALIVARRRAIRPSLPLPRTMRTAEPPRFKRKIIFFRTDLGWAQRRRRRRPDVVHRLYKMYRSPISSIIQVATEISRQIDGLCILSLALPH